MFACEAEICCGGEREVAEDLVEEFVRELGQGCWRWCWSEGTRVRVLQLRHLGCIAISYGKDTFERQTCTWIPFPI